MWENTSDGRAIYTYDDGSQVGYSVSNPSDVWSRDIGSTQWVNDPTPAMGRDAVEAAKLAPYQPGAGTMPMWEAIAQFGITRAIDSHYNAKAYPAGSMPATYAGQNGMTYVNGRGWVPTSQAQGGGGGLGMLMLLGAAAFAFMG